MSCCWLLDVRFLLPKEEVKPTNKFDLTTIHEQISETFQNISSNYEIIYCLRPETVD